MWEALQFLFQSITSQNAGEYQLKDPWQKKVQKKVNIAKKNNLIIKDYFKDSCGIDIDTIEIPFNNFSWEDF